MSPVVEGAVAITLGIIALILGLISANLSSILTVLINIEYELRSSRNAAVSERRKSDTGSDSEQT